MLNTLRIDFKNLDRSDAVEADVRRHAEKLTEFCDRIQSCQVVIDRPHAHQRQGKLFRVRIDLTLPGHELVVNRAPDEAQQHEDVYVAVRDAFDALRRQLEDVVRKDRHQVKQHEGPDFGHVNQLFPLEEYGFLVARDGREIYFHRNSVLDDDWGRLDIGSEVRFTEEEGDRGPQAASVRAVDHRQHDQGVIRPAQS